MSGIHPLEVTVALLSKAYDDVEQDVRDHIAAGRFLPSDANPLLLRDTNGRYLLLDALTALVGAQTALAASRLATT